MKGLIFDPQIGGCSGDMFISALIDLTNDTETLEELVSVINTITEAKLSFSAEKLVTKGISATKLQIFIEKDLHIHHGTELIDLAEEILSKLGVSSKAHDIVKRSFALLLKAESIVHGKSIDEVHLHETASIDTLFDIIGVILLLEKNNLLESPKLGLPVNVGTGTIKIAHGVVSVPPPAVAKILELSKYPFFSDGTKGELLTPTGAVLLCSLSTSVTEYIEPCVAEGIGYGVGTKELSQRANVFRILQVSFRDEIDFAHHTMLETHLDDVSGEILGALVDKLLSNNALDVAYYPIFMKKNRPAYNLRVICRDKDAKDLAILLIKETGTLGVRLTRLGRYEVKRRIEEHTVQFNNLEFRCRIKVREINDEVIGYKPEFKDLQEIAKATGIPLLTVEKEVLSQINRSSQ
ncbi:MAG: nickel pincer cofactor biosynthesis protein LarC [Candidatus Heimdallarchaeaceae archaeon]